MTLNELETKVNDGLKANSIDWASGRAWEKNGKTRIYLNVKGASEGFIELQNDAITINKVSRLNLVYALEAILPEAKVVR